MIAKRIFVYPKYPENLQRLYDLSANLWSAWDYEAISLFYRIDTATFRRVNHNPVKFLNNLSKEKLESLSRDKGFLFELDKVWEKFRDYLEYSASSMADCRAECEWAADEVIAYFSMEFGLHECIPIYAGGLGILAGDFLKGASDLDVPVVGVGLLYRAGYFTQVVDMKGEQQEIYTPFENHLIPIREVHDEEGNWAHVEVDILDKKVKAKVWEIDVGKVKLILLDTDIEENPPQLRDITNELYASDRDKRMEQELVLGIGGIKALEMIKIKVRVYHFNEGHSSLGIIGRLQELMGKKKMSLAEAKAIIRATTVFTTHTPVVAGNENFETVQVKKYLNGTVERLGLDFEQVAEMGGVGNSDERFWLPALAMRFSRYVNGVSVQHSLTARKMWKELYYNRPIADIPITNVTNGVHISWISHPFVDLFNRYLGPDYIRCGRGEDVWKNIYNIPDTELWEEHRRNKKDMINFIRREFAAQMALRGYSQARGAGGKLSLNTDYLTIVFARRFAGYKRPTLILHDKERFRKILTSESRPMQMIFAGKAHPADNESKQMIKEVLDFARDYRVQDRVIFLEDYDMNTARHLVWGADVWLNNPAPDMEASGTSGMKAAMNGVLQLSGLEGWWVEGYNGRNGWAITAGRTYSSEDLQAAADANQLYDLLEHEIAEYYYDRNEADVPAEWVRRMKDSIFSVCQDFNMNRMLCDYLRKAYIPSAKYSRRITENNNELLKKAMDEEAEVLAHWEEIRILSFSTNIEQKDHLTEGVSVDVECRVRFGKANREFFKVELFYMYDEERSYKVLEMDLVNTEKDVHRFRRALELEGFGAQSLNVRVRPANEIVQDIHAELIKWME